MLYGNYMQALHPGVTTPVGATNAGQTFPPYSPTQYELGAKVDFGTVTATLSPFQIHHSGGIRRRSADDFVVDGEQRNRGPGAQPFGEPFDGLRVLGGVTLFDAVQVSTAGGVNNGQVAIGTAPVQFAVGAEWDTPFAQGFG